MKKTIEQSAESATTLNNQETREMVTTRVVEAVISSTASASTCVPTASVYTRGDEPMSYRWPIRQISQGTRAKQHFSYTKLDLYLFVALLKQ